MTQSLRSLWKEGVPEREPFLQRAREVAYVTLPYLAPDLDMSKRGEDLPRPYQSTGGRGAHNLAAKFTVGLFPPSAPFFRYEIDRDRVVELGLSGEQFGAMKLALSKRERSIQRKFDTSGFRPRSFEAFLNLILLGNFLLHLSDDGSVRGFRLDQFQVERDGEDKPSRILVHEVVRRDTLPEEIQTAAKGTEVANRSERDEVDLFTGVFREDKNWVTWQEAGDIPLDGQQEVKDADLPWLPLRMIPDSNEDYGRSFGETVLGDLQVLEGMTQAIVELAAISSKAVGIVDPASGLRPAEISNAKNGEWLIGKPDLLRFVSVDKLNDITVASQVAERVRQDLRQAFLLLTPVRDAERVTAEEVRETVRELTEALGGPFSLLADEFQLPLVRKMERRMLRKGELTRIPLFDEFDTTGIKIVTGIDAIGRSRDEVKLTQFVGTIQQTLGPEGIRYINTTDFLTKLAAAQGVDEGLVRSEEEVQQQIQQEQLAEFAQRVGPQGVKSLENLATQEQQNG